MAGGTIKLKSNKPWEGEILWTGTKVSGKNASDVEARCYVWRTDDGESFGNNPYWGQISIGSTKSSFSFKRITGERYFAGSCWAQIPHDGNGNAAVEIKAIVYGSDNNDLTGSTLEGAMTVTLDPISQVRATEMTLSRDSIRMGQNLMISLSPQDPNCTHVLRYTFGAASGLIADKVKTSAAWTVPDLSEFCGLSGLCSVTCRTFLGEKDLGTTEKVLTIQVPEGTKAQLPKAVLGISSQVDCKRKAKNFSLEVSLTVGEKEYAVGKGREDGFFWTPPYEIAALQPDLTEIAGVLRCRTLNNGSLVSTLDSEVMLTVPRNEHTVPKITSLVLTPETGTIPKEFSYLRGKTGVKAEITAESACSQLSEYFLRAGTVTAAGNPAVIPILEDSGRVEVTATVRDLRGFEASLTRTIEVIPYEKPRVLPCQGETKVICGRADADGALNPQGTCLAIRAGLRFTSILRDGKDLNKATLSYRHRRGEEAYSQWIPLITGEKTEIRTLIHDLLPDQKHTFRVQLRAADSLMEETILTFSLGSQAVSFCLYDGVDGASFGKYPEQAHVVDLAEHMTLLVRGKLELRGEIWQDLGLAPGVSAPPQPHGQVEGAKLRIRGGSQVVLAFSCRMPPDGYAVNAQPVEKNLLPEREVSSLSSAEEGMVQVILGTDGFLRVKPLYGKQDPAWIDGNLQYFISGGSNGEKTV